VRLLLGEHEGMVGAGESAAFATMTPHALAGIEGPAELITIFDRDGQRDYVDHETGIDSLGGGSLANVSDREDRHPTDARVRTHPARPGESDQLCLGRRAGG